MNLANLKKATLHFTCIFLGGVLGCFLGFLFYRDLGWGRPHVNYVLLSEQSWRGVQMTRDISGRGACYTFDWPVRAVTGEEKAADVLAMATFTALGIFIAFAAARVLAPDVNLHRLDFLPRERFA